MKEDNKKILNVPHLRFKEFSGEWEKGKLNNYVDFLKGNGVAKTDLSNEGHPCVLYGQLYTTYKNEVLNDVVSYTNIKSNNLVYSLPNDVIIPASGETPEDIATARCIIKDNVIIGGDLNILRPKNHSGIFLSYQLNGKRKYDIAKVAVGKSIVHLHNENLSNIVVYFPIYNEEEIKIVELLRLIDKRIETQMKIIKEIKSLIHNIKNKVIDNLIFVKWIKIKDICTIKTGKLDANAMKENGKYKFFTCSKDDYYINEYAFDGESLIISGNGELGLIKYYNGKFNAYQRTYVLQNFKLSPIYIKFMMEYYLPRKIYKEKNVGAMPYIVLSTIAELEIPVADNRIIKKMEQLYLLLNKRQNINIIQLNHLKKQKQFLLNNMFI